MTTVRQRWEPLLSAAEEVALAREIEAGVLARAILDGHLGHPGAEAPELLALVALGERAWHHFVAANLRLVAMVAGQVAGRTRLPHGDLFQEGCLGLTLAAQRFDERRGVRFATYALFWIRAYVGAAAARALGEVNLPTHRAEQLRAIRALEAQLSMSLGRAVTTTELAAAIGRPEDWTAALTAYQPPYPIDDVDPARLVAPGGDALHQVLDAGRPGRELLGHAEPLERQVLELRLGFADGRPHSYVETARALGITVARARRAEERGLDRLRAVCPQSASVHL